MPARSHQRWVVLGVVTAAQGCTAAYLLGLAAIIPALRSYFGLSLPEVGALVGVTSIGVLAALIAWGRATDRFGERPVMVVGLIAAAGFLGVAAGQRDPVVVGVLLVAAGAAGASTNAASGRAVLLWFPDRERGFAMGLRQTALPLGAAAAAVSLPAVAGLGGVPLAFAVLAAAAAVIAGVVAIAVREPPGAAGASLVGAPADEGPGRKEPPPLRATLADRRLGRISLCAGLLVVPQFLGAVFLVELLHDGHGVPLAAAGGLLALSQLLAAAGRVVAGVWSDRLGRRIRPLRHLVVVIAAGFVLAAVLDAAPVAVLAVGLVLATATANSWNGLAFTAVSEMVPRQRVGTALAFENSANYLSGSATPVIGGAVAQAAGWPAMLTLGAVAAVASWLLLGALASTEPRLPDRHGVALSASSARKATPSASRRAATTPADGRPAGSRTPRAARNRFRRAPGPRSPAP